MATKDVPQEKPAAKKADTGDYRDVLTEEYLNAMDEYMTLYSELSDLLAKGYFGIAAANRSRTSARTRIGAAMYDERVKANVTIKKTEDKFIMQRNKEANDPIRMFGVLVPPELRTAQTQFSGAVEKMVAVVNAIKALDNLEHKLQSKPEHQSERQSNRSSEIAPV